MAIIQKNHGSTESYVSVKLAESMWALLKEFCGFCKQEKKWWLIPLIVLLLVVGAILIFTATSGIAWALYPFM